MGVFSWPSNGVQRTMHTRYPHRAGAQPGTWEEDRERVSADLLHAIGWGWHANQHPVFFGVRWHGTCKQHFLVATHGWSFGKVSELFALAIPF
jgi:hypothetical protein